MKKIQIIAATTIIACLAFTSCKKKSTTTTTTTTPTAALGTVIWGTKTMAVKSVTVTGQKNATLTSFNLNAGVDTVAALTIAVDSSLTTAGTYTFTNNVLPLASGKISYSITFSTPSGNYWYEVSLLDKSGTVALTKNNGKTQYVANSSQAHKPSLALGEKLSFNVEN
jgi:hypothetical protein